MGIGNRPQELCKAGLAVECWHRGRSPVLSWGSWQAVGKGQRAVRQARLPVQCPCGGWAFPWRSCTEMPHGGKCAQTVMVASVNDTGHTPKYPLRGPVCFTGSTRAPCWDLAGREEDA